MADAPEEPTQQPTTIQTFKFTCQRCHHGTNKKEHMLNHINRKNRCQALYSNATVEIMLAFINATEKHKYQCKDCEMSYEHSSSLSRHKRIYHKPRVPVTRSDNNMAQMTTNSTLTESDTNVDINATDAVQTLIATNSTLNNNNNNNQNIHIENLTINLLPFGSETTDHVDDELLKKTIGHLSGEGLPNLLQHIFFNDDQPQNKNVKVGKERHPPEMNVYAPDSKGNLKWIQKGRKDVLEKMVDKGMRLVVTYNFAQMPDGEFTEDQRQTFDARAESIGKITSKVKGTYARVRDDVLTMARNHD